MKHEMNHHSRTALAALGMFAVFAIAILSVLFGGGAAYRRLTRENSIHYDTRTAISYLATKVRQAPAPETVDIGTFGDNDALLIRQNLEGAEYLTRIYCHNGWLMELFTPDEEGFSPEDGEKILPMDGIALTWEGSRLVISVTEPTGSCGQIKLHIRGSEVSRP